MKTQVRSTEKNTRHFALSMRREAVPIRRLTPERILVAPGAGEPMRRSGASENSHRARSADSAVCRMRRSNTSENSHLFWFPRRRNILRPAPQMCTLRPVCWWKRTEIFSVRGTPARLCDAGPENAGSF